MPSTLEKKILARLDDFEKRIEELELAGKTKIEVLTKAPEASSTPIPYFPVPSEYVSLIKEIFNDKFRIEVDPSPARPEFTLKVFVPKEYSNADEATWKDHKQDMRTKVITYGEGLLGVKTYLELIKKNLGPDINAKIQLDKNG